MMMRSEDEFGIHGRPLGRRYVDPLPKRRPGAYLEREPVMETPVPPPPPLPESLFTMTHSHRRNRPWSRRPIFWIGIAAALLLGVCLGNLDTSAKPVANTPAAPVATASAPNASPAVEVLAPAPTTKPPVQPVTVTGSGSSVANTAALSGGYKVDYQFGSWCGIAHFLNASGEPAAGFAETINECAGSTSAKLSGSTIVHLKDASVIKVENTKGKWSLTLTPLASLPD